MRVKGLTRRGRVWAVRTWARRWSCTRAVRTWGVLWWITRSVGARRVRLWRVRGIRRGILRRCGGVGAVRTRILWRRRARSTRAVWVWWIRWRWRVRRWRVWVLFVVRRVCRPRDWVRDSVRVIVRVWRVVRVWILDSCGRYGHSWVSRGGWGYSYGRWRLRVRWWHKDVLRGGLRLWVCCWVGVRALEGGGRVGCIVWSCGCAWVWWRRCVGALWRGFC